MSDVTILFGRPHVPMYPRELYRAVLGRRGSEGRA